MNHRPPCCYHIFTRGGCISNRWYHYGVHYWLHGYYCDTLRSCAHHGRRRGYFDIFSGRKYFPLLSRCYAPGRFVVTWTGKRRADSICDIWAPGEMHCQLRTWKWPWLHCWFAGRAAGGCDVTVATSSHWIQGDQDVLLVESALLPERHNDDLPTLNPLRAKFFRGNINMYLHFIHPHWHDTGSWNPSSCKTMTYLFYLHSAISWLLMSWRRNESGHQQPRYLLCWNGLIRPRTLRVGVTYRDRVTHIDMRH